jgi:hypothetical protein
MGEQGIKIIKIQVEGFEFQLKKWCATDRGIKSTFYQVEYKNNVLNENQDAYKNMKDVRQIIDYYLTLLKFYKKYPNNNFLETRDILKGKGFL